MEIVLNRPDKSCWQYSAYTEDKSLGSIIFSIRNQSTHIGYIALTREGQVAFDQVAKPLLQSCIDFSILHDCHSIRGTIIPVPGHVHAVLKLLTEFDFSYDKRGQIYKQLSAD